MHSGWMYKTKWWLGGILWVLSVVALVMAWVASASTNGLFLQLPVAHLFWDALILGVLALGCKMDMGYCGGCGTCMPEEKDSGMDMMKQNRKY